MAICLLESGNDDDEKDSNDVEAKMKRRLESKEEAARLMVRVPDLRQKIAGKSIPLEVWSQFHLRRKSHLTLSPQKFVARKARKFQSQNRHLALPALELAYIFGGIAHAPRTYVVDKMLPHVDIVLTRLDQSKDDIGGYIGGRESYWDDFCLGMFLKGVCMRYVAYPVGCFVILQWY